MRYMKSAEVFTHDQFEGKKYWAYFEINMHVTRFVKLH